MVSPGGTDKAPDGGFGWVVVFASFMQHVLSIGIAYTIGVFYPVLMENFSLSSSAAAWVGAMHFATFFGMGSSQHFMTRLRGNYTGRRSAWVVDFESVKPPQRRSWKRNKFNLEKIHVTDQNPGQNSCLIGFLQFQKIFYSFFFVFLLTLIPFFQSNLTF